MLGFAINNKDCEIYSAELTTFRKYIASSIRHLILKYQYSVGSHVHEFSLTASPRVY